MKGSRMRATASMPERSLIPRRRAQLFCTLLLCVQAGSRAYAFDIRGCDAELGLASGDVPDEAITATSSYVPNVGPQYGRLRGEVAGGAWCPKVQIERGVREYLQVDLGEVHFVTGVQTQGRYDHGRGQEYAEEYMLEYWRPGLDKWREYKRWDGKQVLSGNSDTATVVSHRLMPPIYASQVRILPHSIHRRTVCLRAELKGCFAEDGVVSYSIPEDAARDAGHELGDISYDGERRDGRLLGGLGRLVDGEVGGDNFRLDIGYGKGNGWVAWKNDSFPGPGFVELVFRFAEVRNFSAVHIFANNLFSRHVRVFAKAKVLFSVGGRFYNGRPLVYTYMPDVALENARNVSILLHGRVGSYVKIQLYFAARWIMISEVAFDSVPFDGNATVETEESPSDDELFVNPLDPGLPWDAFETITAPQEGQGYVEVVIGVLTAITLLLLVAFVVILVLSRRQKLQGSPTILRNPFGVTVNMKDLLLNLSPMSGGGGGGSGGGGGVGGVALNVPTPPGVMCDAVAEPLVEERRASLASGHAASYATLRGVGDDRRERGGGGGGCGDVGSFASLQFRSLQTTPVVAARSEAVNLDGYFPRVGTDPPTRKRYHTAPREKHRPPPPVVTWNIAPCMGQAYKCREAELVPIPRYCLRMVDKVGACRAGEVMLCETDGLADIVPGVGRMVAVRTASTKADGGTADALREVRFLASLSDPNVVRVLGVCTAEQPVWTVLEYPEMGDLVHYLQYRLPMSATLRPSEKLQALSYGCLIFMATQIASGMKYLESKNVVHKDLAARNCLVGRGYSVKVADVAVCSQRHAQDYAEIGGRPPAPIRWLPWESILLDRYSSSAWAYGVTLWEILSLAREQPYQDLSNDQVVQNAERMYYGEELQILLPKPTLCPIEMYELICECWRRDESLRPNFKEIVMFLKRRNIGYRPGD